MTEPTGRQKAQARQSRTVAVVIIATLVLWMGAQFAGARFGLTARTVLLFDLLALAAFLWAFIVTYQIWRKRRDNEG
ncbi:DUF5337 family protein [Psychromarinibacter halotolerans]|uniref:DUF5337 family protein n=1 Tax=Psychromarinibacter halotolerans TaxID=1775175 RepID=A0ABV7GRN3_9RHOB|nr:DUF5337 family protein [Psychromarinibacter halotolerans]MAQ86312.1 hypothetical protein [Maritimibacter sp.]MDF0596936.1 DUF5337 family protein [Psychromarinibacter halotolerans]